jgi:hypothetical protein
MECNALSFIFPPLYYFALVLLFLLPYALIDPAQLRLTIGA